MTLRPTTDLVKSIRQSSETEGVWGLKVIDLRLATSCPCSHSLKGWPDARRTHGQLCGDWAQWEISQEETRHSRNIPSSCLLHFETPVSRTTLLKTANTLSFNIYLIWCRWIGSSLKLRFRSTVKVKCSWCEMFIPVSFFTFSMPPGQQLFNV